MVNIVCFVLEIYLSPTRNPSGITSDFKWFSRVEKIGKYLFGVAWSEVQNFFGTLNDLKVRGSAHVW